MKLIGILVGATALFAAASANATLITFEDQPAGPANFSAAGPAQTLVYHYGAGDTATFTGGVILTDESNQTTDNSNVYATAAASLVGADPSLTNPLTVTFSAPVQNFQIEILNALAGNYEMSDNAGNSVMFNLATTGGSIQTEGFAATGTVVNIAYLDAPTQWDFAIDNVTFNQPLGGIPEPSTWAIMLMGFGGLGLAMRSRRKTRALAA